MVKTFSPVKLGGKVGTLTLQEESLVFKSKKLQMETSYPWGSIKKHLIKSTSAAGEEEKHMLKLVLLDDTSVIVLVQNRDKLEEIKAEISNFKKRRKSHQSTTLQKAPAEVAAGEKAGLPPKKNAPKTIPDAQQQEQPPPKQPVLPKKKSSRLYPTASQTAANLPDAETPEVKKLRQFASPPSMKKGSVKSIPGAHSVSPSRATSPESSKQSQGDPKLTASPSTGETSEEFIGSVLRERQLHVMQQVPPTQPQRRAQSEMVVSSSSKQKTTTQPRKNSPPRKTPSAAASANKQQQPTSSSKPERSSTNSRRAARARAASPPRQTLPLRRVQTATGAASTRTRRQSPTRTRTDSSIVPSPPSLSAARSEVTTRVRNPRKASPPKQQRDSIDSDDVRFITSVLQERQTAVLRHSTGAATATNNSNNKKKKPPPQQQAKSMDKASAYAVPVGVPTAAARSSSARRKSDEDVSSGDKKMPAKAAANGSAKARANSDRSLEEEEEDDDDVPTARVARVSMSEVPANGIGEVIRDIHQPRQREAAAATAIPSSRRQQSQGDAQPGASNDEAQGGLAMTTLFTTTTSHTFLNPPAPVPAPIIRHADRTIGAVRVAGANATDDEDVDDCFDEECPRPMEGCSDDGDIVERNEAGDVLIEARLVEDSVPFDPPANNHHLVEASPVPEKEEIGYNDIWRSRKARVVMVGLLCLMLVIMTTVILVVTLQSKDDNEEGGNNIVIYKETPPPVTVTRAPTSSPTYAPTMRSTPAALPLLEDAYGHLPDYTLAALLDPESPQSQALEYLSNIPRLESMSGAKVRQRYGLSTLFYATNGPSSWRKTRGWLDNTNPVCNWYMANPACPNGAGNFLSINLPDNHLEGTLPPELFHSFKRLTSLDLSDNARLRGTLSSDIGKLRELVVLRLSETGIRGQLPPELGELSNLEELSIGDCALTGTIPSEIGLLSNLLILELSNNQLSGTLPSEIGLLSNLVVLSVGENSLSGSLPSELANMPNLEYADFSATDLEGPLPLCHLFLEGVSEEVLISNSGLISCP